MKLFMKGEELVNRPDLLVLSFMTTIMKGFTFWVEELIDFLILIQATFFMMIPIVWEFIPMEGLLNFQGLCQAASKQATLLHFLDH